MLITKPIGGPCSPVLISGNAKPCTDTSGIDFAFSFNSFMIAVWLFERSFQSFNVTTFKDWLELGAPEIVIANCTSGVLVKIS